MKPTKTIFIVPGATTAGDSIDLPGGIRAASIARAVRVRVYDGSTVGGITELTVVDTTPSSGQIYLESPTSIVLGDDTTDYDILILEIEELEGSSLS